MGVITDTYTAKAKLSEFLDKVEAGEEVTITRRGKPIAKLVRYEEARPRRRFGQLAGLLTPEELAWDKHTDPEWQRMIRSMTGEEVEDGAPKL